MLRLFRTLLAAVAALHAFAALAQGAAAAPQSGATATQASRSFGVFLGSDAIAPKAMRADPVAELTVRHAKASRGFIPALASAHARGEDTAFEIDLLHTAGLRAQVQEVAPTHSGGVAIIAKVLEEGGGTIALVQNGAHIVGSVNFAGGHYLIETIAPGIEKVAKLLPQLLPPELPPLVPPPGSDTGPDAVRLDAADASLDPPVDSGRRIDLMVIYTPAARAGLGTVPLIEGRIDLGVAESNAAYLNSGVGQRLFLVHKQELAYTEANNLSTDLNRLTNTADGILDSVHTLRNTHGADLVKLVVAGTSACGVAWLIPSLTTGNATLGFSVTHYTCISPNYTFAHELGHNMGLMHDPYAVTKYGEGSGPAPYAYGFVDLVRRWRTVMAYNDQCLDQVGQSCQRALLFSTPRFAFDHDGAGVGQSASVMGTAGGNNNALVLNKTAKIISNYRATSQLHPVTPTFADVATNHPFFGFIEFMSQAQITSGCAVNPTRYCPDAPVTRGQMAVFVEKTLRASNWVPPTPTGIFSDVPTNALFANYIEAFRNDGITSGCATNPLRYCPDDVVTRGQMAVFILKAKCGSTYPPASPPTPSFADVPTNHPFYNFIQKFYALGITSGCATGPLRYCPDNPVTRGQMAVFIEKAFPPSAPTEVCAP